MADERALLKILIELGVIGQEDAKAAKQLLEETGATGKDAMKGMNESMPENLAAWKNYSKNVYEAGGETSGMHEKVTELRKVLGKMGPEYAELGGLLKFAMNPAVLGTVAAIAVTKMYFKHLEEVEQKYRDLIRLGQTVNDDMREIIAARPTEIDSWMKLVEQMAELKVNVGSARADFDLINNTLRAKDQNTAKYSADKDQAERDVITNEIARAKSEIEAAKAVAGSRTGNVETTQKAANDADARRDDLKNQIEKLPKAISDAQAAIDEAKRFKIGPLTSDAEIARNREFLESQVNLKARLEDQLERAKKQFPGAVTDAAQAAENLRAAKENNQRLTDLSRTIGELNAKLDILKDEQGKRRVHDRDTALENAFHGAAGALDAQSQGKKLTDAQRQQINELQQILTGSGVNAQVVLQLLKMNAGNIAWQARELETLKRYVAQRPVN